MPPIRYDLRRVGRSEKAAVRTTALKSMGLGRLVPAARCRDAAASIGRSDSRRAEWSSPTAKWAAVAEATAVPRDWATRTMRDGGMPRERT